MVPTAANNVTNEPSAPEQRPRRTFKDRQELLGAITKYTRFDDDTGTEEEASGGSTSIGDWDVSRVTDFSFIFKDINFNEDISGWDVSNAIDMQGMFFQNKTFDQDLSSWNVSNVVNMSFMFYGATSFNQDLSCWDVGHVEHISKMLRNTRLLLEDNSRSTLLYVALVEKSPAITKLNLSGHSIGNNSCKKLFEALRNIRSFAEMDLSNNKIGDDACQSIGNLLWDCDSLLHLNLEGNRIGDEGCTQISAGLENNTTLQTLHLGNNNIGDVGCDELLTCFESNFAHSDSCLLVLGLSSNQSIDENDRSYLRHLMASRFRELREAPFYHEVNWPDWAMDEIEEILGMALQTPDIQLPVMPTTSMDVQKFQISVLEDERYHQRDWLLLLPGMNYQRGWFLSLPGMCDIRDRRDSDSIYISVSRSGGSQNWILQDAGSGLYTIKLAPDSDEKSGWVLAAHRHYEKDKRDFKSTRVILHRDTSKECTKWKIEEVTHGKYKFTMADDYYGNRGWSLAPCRYYREDKRDRISTYLVIHRDITYYWDIETLSCRTTATIGTAYSRDQRGSGNQ